MKRAATWGTDSSLRVRDIREYLEWQLKAVSEGLGWYYGMHQLAKAINERTDPLVKLEIVDRMEKEVREHARHMLCNGRFPGHLDGHEEMGDEGRLKKKQCYH